MRTRSEERQDVDPNAWSSDFDMGDGALFGEWLYREIDGEVYIEQNGFMPDRVRAVAARLQDDRPVDERFVGIVPWLDSFYAFTAPGKYVYFGRRLLERCPHEDSVAFVLAHEIAHHDLGHLDYFSGPFARRLATLSAGAIAVLFFRNLQRRIHSPERELAADYHAVDLCLRAGYDPNRFLYLFHVLELIYLDYKDSKAVYGLETESDQELSPEASLATKARIWLYQRERGYLPVQDRLAAIKEYCAWKHGFGEIHLQGA
jgi:hypothetical protein